MIFRHAIKIGWLLYFFGFGNTFAERSVTDQGLALDPSCVDLGSVLCDSTIETKITLKNQNQMSPIGVTAIKGSCSCFHIELSRSTIPVGGTAVVLVKQNSGHISRTIKESIIIETIDNYGREKHIITAPIIGKVQSIAKLDPSRIELTLDEQGKSATQAQIVITRGDSNVTWSSISASSDPPDVLTAIVRQDNPDCFVINVTCAGAKSAEELKNTMLRVHFIDKAETKHVAIVPIHIKHIERIAVNPRSLYFHTVGVGDTQEFAVAAESIGNNINMDDVICDLSKSPSVVLVRSRNIDTSKGSKEYLFQLKPLVDGLFQEIIQFKSDKDSIPLASFQLMGVATRENAIDKNTSSTH